MTDPSVDEGAMTFWEHLDELRARMIKALLAFLVGAIVAWVFKEELLVLLTRPFVEGWHGPEGSHPTLHFPAPASLFLAYVKLAVLGGFVLSLPIVLYQVWAFIAPGLYAREKRFAIPFVVISCLLFALGAFFGWRVVFPLAFDYLLGFSQAPLTGPLQVQPTVMVGDYIEFVTRALLAFGAVFEIPVVVFFLTVAGVINHIHLIKFARYFIVIAFILGAVITPPDPMSQLMLAIPLCVLYTLSIGIAWLFSRRRTAAAARAET
jgi:sec-independent protein translocase protein TatC